MFKQIRHKSACLATTETSQDVIIFAIHFLAVPWGCLWFVIVVFPDHTHILFLTIILSRK